jgi:excisionase family DNA binding protein
VHTKREPMIACSRPALTEQQVAARLGLSVATLRAWRLKGKGPPFVRFGRAVRYLEEDVERFVEACRANGAVHAHAS